MSRFIYKCPDCPKKFSFMIHLIHHVMGTHGWEITKAEELIKEVAL